MIDIVYMEFGSGLYGTKTPDSDTDYRGIRLSSWEEIALGKVPKEYKHASTGDMFSKNSKDDVDESITSLHQFVKEALEGNTFAIDMLHAPKSKLLATSPIWKDLVANRSKFYTKSIKSFVNYAQGQAAKYGVKGSRLNDAKAVLDWFDIQEQGIKVLDTPLNTFPVGEHIVWHTQSENGLVALVGSDMVEVCNRKFNLSVKVSYAKDIVQKFYDNYGSRAKQAANNEGVDWKAMHHAVRAGYQTLAIFRDGGFEYPLVGTQHLIDIKLGKLPYLDVATELDDLIDRIKIFSDLSSLPDLPDASFWEKWLISIVEDFVVPPITTGKIRWV